MRINKNRAKEILFREADKAKSPEHLDSAWVSRVQEFSTVCESTSKTHIAFLGTSILAKAVSLSADVFAVKAGANTPGAFSARGLGHGVLVPFSPELEINLGVTGREPLNNQPYFRINRVSREIPIHSNAKPALDALCDILEELEKVSSNEEALNALRAFIYVRRQYSPTYGKLGQQLKAITPDKLVAIIESFVSQNSEGGKRAQAVAAGMMDLFAGKDRVDTSRVNDPDRHFPGDVCILVDPENSALEKVFEVRDKPVSQQDLYLFAQKASETSVKEAAVIAVSAMQKPIAITEPQEWAQNRGMALTVFIGWNSFIRQALFWSNTPQLEAASLASTLIYDRVTELEISGSGAEYWLSKLGY